jgi:hemerythrin-like domain-containing protein
MTRRRDPLAGVAPSARRRLQDAGVLNGGSRSIEYMATKKQESKRPEKGSGGMDAITLLKKDHDDVNRMFEEFETSDEDRKFELAAEICQALTVHATIEEEIFYPQAREAIDAEDLMMEAEVEHDSARYLIERIQEGELDETQLSAMIKVLKEYVGHHINEEQRKMFPRVKRGELDLEAIGRELMERKAELESELGSAMADDDSADADDEDEQGSGRSRGGMAARDKA